MPPSSCYERRVLHEWVVCAMCYGLIGVQTWAWQKQHSLKFFAGNGVICYEYKLFLTPLLCYFFWHLHKQIFIQTNPNTSFTNLHWWLVPADPSSGFEEPLGSAQDNAQMTKGQDIPAVRMKRKSPVFPTESSSKISHLKVKLIQIFHCPF